MNIPLILLIFIGFLAGIYYCATTKSSVLLEGMTTKAGPTRCPDMLIQKGPRFLLYNSKVAQVPGVNPIEFQNLEDYTEFIDWQRSQGINCPVLYLQHSYNTQGESVYKVRPSPTDLQGGLPTMIPKNMTTSTASSVVTPGTNVKPRKSTTRTSSHIGIGPVPEDGPTPTGPSKADGLLFSPDAMDDNWGGPNYTDELINEGYYQGNQVDIYIP